MSPTTLPTARAPAGLCGGHVALIFFSFFAVIFVVNGVMVYSAITTHTGIVSNEPYRKGLHYNERIADDERQATLGWRDDVALTRDGRIAIALVAEQSRPVSGMKVAAQIGRPSTNRFDTRLNLHETAPGHYEAQAGTLQAGAWIVALEVRTDLNAAEPVYRMRRRLWLKQ
jgi:nitrogen fixation protein FixH